MTSICDNDSCKEYSSSYWMWDNTKLVTNTTPPQLLAFEELFVLEILISNNCGIIQNVLAAELILNNLDLYSKPQLDNILKHTITNHTKS